MESEMTVLPRICALFLALALPIEAAALTLGDLEGRWRGEGTLTLNNEPEQRLRCQIRFRAAAGGRSFFSGRCATAQASRSFTYMLIPSGRGIVRAENQMTMPDTPPQTMEGLLGTDSLRFQGEGQALIELRLVGGELEFRIQGDGSDGFAHGQAQLRRATGDDSRP